MSSIWCKVHGLFKSNLFLLSWLLFFFFYVGSLPILLFYFDEFLLLLLYIFPICLLHDILLQSRHYVINFQ
ncbi:hypothetical protein JHK84_051157 [Glycine max]|nr:hypothetical protein JHK84_051157 [Glycine max]